MLQVLDELGVPIPDARLDSALTLEVSDSVDAVRLFCVGSYAASRARWQVLRGSLEQLQSRAQRVRATGNSSEAGFTRLCGRHSKDTRAWRRGRRDDACACSSARNASHWRLAAGIVNIRLRWWLGRLLTEMGRPREALPVLRVLDQYLAPRRLRARPDLRAARRGRAGREAYALFLAPRQQADSMFQPMIQQARAALQRLAVATTKSASRPPEPGESEIAKVTLLSLLHPSMPARAVFARPAPAYGVKGVVRGHLCRTYAGTGDNWRLQGTTDPRRKANNHKPRVVCSCPLCTPSLGLRILSRKGWGFNSPRSHSLLKPPSLRSGR